MMNKAYTERITAFNKQTDIRITPPKRPGPGGKPDPKDFTKAVEFLENGDIVVRVVAPTIDKVTMSSVRLAVWKFDIELEKKDKGVFEGVIPASVGAVGNVVVQFRFNDAPVIISSIPVQHYGNQIVNFIEVPDPETPYVEINQVPHGAVTREIFWSESMGESQCCLVYTPPEYPFTDKEYPVLYLQHGGGENETAWVFNGKLPNILDNLIAEGKAVPFIVVMNDGMVRYQDRPMLSNFDAIEDIITKDCRAFIESKYRARKDKWGRAIGGLSMGSMQACYIGMRHPELFSSIGTFTYLRCRDGGNTYESNPHLFLMKDKERFTSEFKLLFRSIGESEAHLNEFEEDDAFVASCGLDRWEGYIRQTYPNQIHNWNCWRRAIWNYAQHVFRW